MSLTRLEYFVAVAEELSFTRAAARLHVSQPPLTQQIRRLEADLGVRLFERTTRRIELTAAGRAVLVESRIILSRHRSLAAIARDATEARVEVLQVGLVPSAVIGIMPALLAEARRRLPTASLVVHEIPVEEQLPLLRHGELDIGIFRSYQPPTELDTTDLASDHYVVALPVEHRLTRKPCVDWQDLENERLIATDRVHAVTEFDSIVAACVANGFSPNIVAESVKGYNTLSLVASGLGVAVVPSLVTSSSRDGVTYRELLPKAASVPMKACAPLRLRSRSSQARQLIEIAQGLPPVRFPPER
jgi:DNA-binding transcriptional LysR family regulator